MIVEDVTAQNPGLVKEQSSLSERGWSSKRL